MLVTFVSAVVGGVNSDVYTEVPFTILKLLMIIGGSCAAAPLYPPMCKFAFPA